MADVIYGDGLVLANTFITHSAVSRTAEVTYAILDDTAGYSAQTWADALQTTFASNWASKLDNGATIAYTKTLKGAGSSIFTTGISTASGTPGTISGSFPPPNWAMLITKLTGYGGRKNTGRMYMPYSVIEGDIGENGHFGGSTLTDRQTAATNWLGDNTDTTFWMVIANRTYDLPWDNPARKLVSVDAGAKVLALSVSGLGATQRKRMRRA